MKYKTCTKCKNTKPITEFYSGHHSGDGFKPKCKKCHREYAKEYAAKRDKGKKLEERKRHYYNHQEERRLKEKQLRQEVLDAYGGQCVCCGDTHYEFLTIDHINGDGQEHRKSVGGAGQTFHRWLKKNGFPKDGLRILCMNCNWAFGKYYYCPHDKC